MSKRVPHLLDSEAPANEASELVRSALRGARSDLPDAARIEALSKAIATAIESPPPPHGGSSGPADPGAVAASGTKLVVGGILVSVAIGVAVFASRGESRDRPSEPSVSPTTASVSATATPSETAIDVHALPAASMAVPSEAGLGSRKPATAVRNVAPAEDEMTLLRAAQEALARSPAEALARCEAHATQHPTGALVEEREVLAVDALLRLGRRKDAEVRAQRFRTEHPASAHVRRLDSLLERDP